jgi:hypothetical protein
MGFIKAYYMEQESEVETWIHEHHRVRGISITCMHAAHEMQEYSAQQLRNLVEIIPEIKTTAPFKEEKKAAGLDKLGASVCCARLTFEHHRHRYLQLCARLAPQG